MDYTKNLSPSVESGFSICSNLPKNYVPLTKLLASVITGSTHSFGLRF